MNSVTQEVVIQAPRSKVWDVLSNLGDVYQYSTNVEFSEYVTDHKSGVGAARKCDLGSAWVTERVTAWSDLEGYTLEIADGGGLGPLKRMLVSFQLYEEGPETRVQQTMAYQMKGGLISPLLGLMAGGQMRKAIEVNLHGLKTFVEQEAQS
ncbi:MAG: SRPBCC family protein [Ardenticatenaceae bacterium]|nr:SRPBCC family protein [Ardenticatenaceae bacterium]